MCGFVGFINKKKLLSDTDNFYFLKKMGKAIIHRGPDYSGSYTNDNIFLWHNRLSIQDLSFSGNQPMLTDDGKKILLFNGEIYNHFDLRKIINKKVNYTWKSMSDTETLLILIEYFGIKYALEVVSGMFSFVYLNLLQKKIYLARDRFGEKPLYYSIDDQIIFFSSELKALKLHPKFNKEINNESLKNYFFYGYVPSPLSIYKNTFKVEPSSFKEINYENFSYQTSTYWDLNNYNKSDKNEITSQNDIKINTKELLSNSIKEQLISDVPLGCFLSGGTDSALITAMTQEISNTNLQTFSIGFENNFFDESKYSSNIANILGTDHSDIQLSNNDILEAVPEMSKIYCEPFADSSQLPTYLLSKFASKQVKVCLSGDGGDELFLGYNRYLYSEFYLSKLKYLPKAMRDFLSFLLLSVDSDTYNRFFIFLKKIKLSETKYEVGEIIHKFAKILKINNVNNIYRNLVSTFDNDKLINDSINLDNSIIFPSFIKDTNDMNFADFKSYLPDDILCKVDRASMSNSLETRMPFLNKDLYKFLSNLSINQKLKSKNLKYISKSILYDYVPSKNFNQQKKGFSIPLDNMIRNELKIFCLDSIKTNSINLKNYINYNYLDKLLNRHFSGRYNYGKEIWNIVMFSE